MALDSNDMTNYIAILKTINENSLEMRDKFEIIVQMYHNISDLLSEPNVLNDHVRLAEYDRFHIEMYESNEFACYFRRQWNLTYLL